VDDQIRSAQEDVERITKELSKVPSESDLIQLEEMAAKIVNALGRNLDIPDTEKRRIMKLLNLKVILTPDKEIKLEGFFYPESSGLLSTAL
jgi:hypothetical protein